MTHDANGSQRVLGWDGLRGLCALLVAFYHVSYWLQITDLPSFATYGVYLFFVLSGASLAYNYPADAVRCPGDVARFLALRWLRLAPLYLVLCGVFLWMLTARTGALPDHLAERLLLNAAFAFGFADPVTWALLIGGWSLGIEFLFYLAFPLIAQVLPHRAWRWGVGLTLVALQVWWIDRTLGHHGWVDGVTAYHHAPAFGAYFFGGCLLGWWRRGSPEAAASSWVAVAGWVFLVGLLVGTMPTQAGDELVGWRGALLPLACFAVAHLSGRARFHGAFATGARHLGDLTYGIYLLHPILLFAMLWFALPAMQAGDPTVDWGMPARWSLLAAVLLAAGLLAVASERWFEHPVRRWSRRVLAPRRDAYSEVASMSR